MDERIIDMDDTTLEAMERFKILINELKEVAFINKIPFFIAYEPTENGKYVLRHNELVPEDIGFFNSENDRITKYVVSTNKDIKLTFSDEIASVKEMAIDDALNDFVEEE